MSETVHYRGILRTIERQGGESLEDQCKRILENRELPPYFESYQEFIIDERYEDITIQNGVIYHVEKTTLDPESDIFRASLEENGEITFEVRYYNGGCSFEEAIEEALSNMSKNGSKL